jgi:peptidoglycan/xylan/chitin deacetylase (PgdA/CDA1 family)
MAARRLTSFLLSSTLAVAVGAVAIVASASPALAWHARPCANGYVGLTYDDGPTAATEPALLAALRAGHARATFFNIGSVEEQNPDGVLAQVRAGMWVGNHTWTHPHLTQIGEPAAFEEIRKTQVINRQILHRTPTLFRPPFGETNDQVRADEARLHLLEVLWTVDSRDWAGATTDEIVAAAATMKNRDIILMHDWPTNSTEAVPRILQGLRDRGLCPGKIAFTHRDISGVGQIFHAIAVRP